MTNKQEIDNLSIESSPKHQSIHIQKPLPRRRWLFGVLMILFLGIGFFVVHTVLGSENSTASISSKLSFSNLAFSTAKNVLTTTALKGQSADRTTIVFYGMTKDDMRTDSIMLVSYYYQAKKLVSINIPRDLFVNDGYEDAKIGEVYAYAKNREPKSVGYPEQFVADFLSKEYGIPIDYWVKVNMQGEVDFVNYLGGIDINVPDSFTDYEYPTWNYTGYIRPAPHFEAGYQHMTGDQALIYSRSRHSLDNNEGTDFARSKRQTLVLQAIIDKLKAKGITGNVSDVSTYLKILGDNLNTSLSTDELVAFAKLLLNINIHKDYLVGNWTTGNGFLCSTTATDGAYIILYGVDGACTNLAGEKQTSIYRKLAQYYIQNLLTSVSYATPVEFVQAAESALSEKSANGSVTNSSAQPGTLNQ